VSYHVIVCGQGGTGKTTVVMNYTSEGWRQQRRRSLVFDPNGANWGGHALVFQGADRLPRFWDIVWKERNCIVVVDEVVTSMPRDADANEVFTRIRHRGHQLVMILHEAANLLPVQRGQCNTLFLFNQHPRSAQMWAEEWNEPRFRSAVTLRKYEFIFAQKFADPSTGFHAVTRGKLAL
jgi:Cdc6-like AAA superfamily ATPase